MKANKPSTISRMTALFLVVTLPITSCRTTSVSTRSKVLDNAPMPVEKISSLDKEKGFASSFSQIYVVKPKSGPGLKLSETNQSTEEMSDDTKKKIIGAVVGSVLGVAVLVGGGVALKKLLSKSNSRPAIPDLDLDDAPVPNRGRGASSVSDDLASAGKKTDPLPGFDQLGRRVGNITPPKPPAVSTSFVQVGRAYDGDFDDVVAAITKEKATIELIDTLEEAKLPSHKRALVVMDVATAQGMDLGPVGSVVRRNVPGTGDVQYQVVGRNGQSVLMAAQRFDDIDAGKFPMNLAVVKGKPWEGAPLLGAGGIGVVFDVDGFAVKVARGDHNQQELAKVLKMQHVDGMIKVKGMYRTDGGELAIMFEKLQRKDFATMGDAEFKRVARDLAGTVDELKKMKLEHEDISPGNIMFRGDKPVLIDVGTGGSTRGYSGMGNDSVALARSLIDMRMGGKIRDDFLSMYDEVHDIMSSVGDDIRKADPEADEYGPIENELIYAFMESGEDFTVTMRYFNLKNVGKAKVRKWTSSGSTSLGIATEGLAITLENFKAIRDMDLATFKQQWDSGLDKQVKDLGYPDLDLMAREAFELGSLEMFMTLKIRAASAQTNASLAKKGAGGFNERHDFLNAQVWAKMAASNQTVGDLIAVADKKMAIGKFATAK